MRKHNLAGFGRGEDNSVVYRFNNCLTLNYFFATKSVHDLAAPLNQELGPELPASSLVPGFSILFTQIFGKSNKKIESPDT